MRGKHKSNTSYLLLRASAGGCPFIFKSLSNLQLLLCPKHCVAPLGPTLYRVLQIMPRVTVLLERHQPYKTPRGLKKSLRGLHLQPFKIYLPFITSPQRVLRFP